MVYIHTCMTFHGIVCSKVHSCILKQCMYHIVLSIFYLCKWKFMIITLSIIIIP